MKRLLFLAQCEDCGEMFGQGCLDLRAMHDHVATDEEVSEFYEDSAAAADQWRAHTCDGRPNVGVNARRAALPREVRNLPKLDGQLVKVRGNDG